MKFPRKLKIRISKRTILYKFSSKIEKSNFQNNYFIQKISENWEFEAPKKYFKYNFLEN